LKEGYRHLYGKRVIYLDEDTGMATMSDFYDARGTLWQYAFLNYYYSFDINAWQAGNAFYFDLNSGVYENCGYVKPLGSLTTSGGRSALTNI
jgi:hypothetical protein